MNKKILSTFIAGVVALSSASGITTGLNATAENNINSTARLEKLDRSITAIKTGNGMLISWRFLANDPDNAIFKLYRNGELIYTSDGDKPTCFWDEKGTADAKYKVETYDGNTLLNSEDCKFETANQYFDIPLDQPQGGSDYTYSPNDCTVGDADGDGEYEIFVKWDPSNSQDNSKSGITGNVYIDCYKMNGTKLWRIDLGKNIRAGAHYTQMLVADFDQDGICELTCKTADGTVDGQGNVIGDSSKDYRNSNGYILDGPEYYTLFDGTTGKALDTVDYNPQRGKVSDWGDKYGNRVDRFLGAVVYLDGVKPSAITVRGYYTRMTACAYDVVDKKLVQKWFYDSGNDKFKGYGSGNHNCMPADVDGDGKQELVLGATCIDDNGELLWCNQDGHGDAMHLGDFLPDREGQELWVCHEVSPYGISLHDAKTGETLFRQNGDKDTGRCCAGNVWSGNNGAEFWGLGKAYDGDGNQLSCNCPAVNFLTYWDGDLEREILDGKSGGDASITNMKDDGTLETIFSSNGYYTCNSTKATPCLSADILGDWREELILRSADGKSLRVFTTPYDTQYRITTLMHDVQYRTQVAGQNIAYNQPPHTSFYLGSDKPVPSRSDGTVEQPTKTPAEFDENFQYVIKNGDKYLEVDGQKAEHGANVQIGTDSTATWSFESAGDGYYKLYSSVGDSKTFLLDLDYGKQEDGTNIGIWGDTKADAQLFKFVDNGDGTYDIVTKSTNDQSCLNADETGDVKQYKCNGGDNQKWTVSIAYENFDTSKNYEFVNNSGKFDYETLADGENVTADVNSTKFWKLVSKGYDYYNIMANDTFALDVDSGKATSGTNVQLWTKNNYSAQLFRFAKNKDGSYTIFTRASKDACCLTEENGNIIQSTYNAGDYKQNWSVREVSSSEAESSSEIESSSENSTPDSSEISVAYGDVNSDGTINTLDALAILKYVVGLETLDQNQFKSADLDFDGKITSADALCILKYVVGIISEFK